MNSRANVQNTAFLVSLILPVRDGLRMNNLHIGRTYAIQLVILFIG